MNSSKPSGSKRAMTLERNRVSVTRSMAKRMKNDDDTSEGTKIDALPDDILIEIIKFLPVAQWPSLESVNRRFRNAAFGAWLSLTKIRLDDDLVIDRKKIREDPVKTLDSLLEKLVRRASNITELSGFPIFATSIRSLSQCGNLRCVTFERGIRLEELTNFLETSSSRGQLRELKVGFMLFHNEVLKQRYDDLLTSAFGNASNRPQLQLEKLVLYSMKLDTFQFLTTIDVSRLTTFKITKTDMAAADLITLLNRAANLENIKFNFWGDCPPYNDGLHLAQNKEILRIIGASTTLLSLYIDVCFAFKCKDCFDIRSEMAEMIVKLGRRCRLEKFSLLQRSLCTDEVVSTIANNMANLKSLKLRTDCTEVPLIQLATNLVRLEKLSLGKTTRKIISTAAANLTQLKYFDVGTKSEETTAMIFQDLAASVSLKELRMIIGDVDMATINKWSDGVGPNLEALELAVPIFDYEIASAEVINKGIQIIVKKFPGLRRLNLIGSKVSDRGLREIASSLPDLLELDLSTCSMITPAGVQSIVDGCPRLKRLRMKYHSDMFRAKMKLGKYSTIYSD